MAAKGNRTKHIPIDERDPATVRAVILARVSDPGAKDITVESQVDACRAFQEAHGWRLLDTANYHGIYAEKKSGYLHVERPMLAEVERLIIRREVDVVVVLNFERLARDTERRHAALYTARKYGVEYRFAELPPDGKLQQSGVDRLLASVLDAYGEINREKIVENTKRGRAKRAVLGIPPSGRGGAPYGLRDATPADTYTRYARRDEEADRLLWMFRRIDEDETASGRKLAGELNVRGWFTREGKQWTSTTVLEKLRNPRYAGRGYVNRYTVQWEPETDHETGETYDVRKVYQRTEDLIPFAKGAEPALIPADLFDRVQRKLDERSQYAGRQGRNEAYPVDATLLQGGLVRCAHCGRAMSRQWRNDGKQPIAYYKCGRRTANPTHECAIHMMPADVVETITLRLLAEALADPNKMAALADAAASKHADAVAEVTLTGDRLGAYGAQLDDVDARLVKLQKVVALLDPTEDADDIAEYREKINALDAKRTHLLSLASQLAPQRAKAEAREALFAAMRTGQLLARVEHEGRVYDLTNITIDDMVTLVLGDNAPQGFLEAMALELIQRDTPDARDLSNPEVRRIVQDMIAAFLHRHTVSRARLAEMVLMCMPQDEVRRLLKHLGVVVRVTRPWAKEERAQRGPTPPEERVSVEVCGLTLRMPARSAYAANGQKLAMPTISTPAAQRSG
jgi:DNA invertase Pin-like site-specific DNA recombinase